jgi:hypothetical protein
VALKPSIDGNRVREEDAQRPATGRPGEEHARLRAERGLSQEALAHERTKIPRRAGYRTSDAGKATMKRLRALITVLVPR